MQVTGLTLEQLNAAAHEVDVVIDNPRVLNKAGTRIRFTLGPKVSAKAYTPSGRRRKGEAGDTRWQRTSTGPFNMGRRVHAVCWHGHRDFFRAAFKRNPDAVFRSSVDTWRGSIDFEERHAASGLKNVGAPIAPIAMAEACRCPHAGTV